MVAAGGFPRQCPGKAKPYTSLAAWPSGTLTAMANERMYPILPCRDIDEAIAFYAALGFEKTYRQVRPNPSAVVARDELPVSGIPRMVRPRKRWGTVYGFSVVDVGGNWLRFSRLGDTESAPDASEPGIQRVTEVAARLADAHGDLELAFRTLDTALAKDEAAAAIDVARARLYHAELAIRLGRPAEAVASLDVIEPLELHPDERASLTGEIAHVTDLLAEHEAPS